MKSLRARLTAATAVIFAVGLGALCASLYWSAAQAAERTARIRAHALADQLAQAVEWEGGRLQRDRHLLRRLAGTTGVAFEIAAADGSRIAAAGPPGWPADGFSPATSASTERSVEGRLWHLTRLPRIPLSEDDTANAPLLNIAVAVDVTDDRAALVRLGFLLALLGPVVLLLGILGVRSAVRRALAPLAEMRAAAATIHARNLSARVPVPDTADELAELGRRLNEALARLEETFHRERAFLADASHELRTPVAISLADLEVTLARERPPGEYRQALETQLATTQRLRSIVESLLTMAAADAGRIRVQRATCDLGRLLADAAQPLRPLAASRNVTLQVETAAALPLEGDPTLLRQLFDNLLVNAIRYNRPGGRVEIGCAGADGIPRAWVRDTGPGIAAEHLPRLFERFYRVDKGRAREEGGAGLGLAIVRWIADAHGASVEVTSTPGEGTAFTVTFPGVSA